MSLYSLPNALMLLKQAAVNPDRWSDKQLAYSADIGINTASSCDGPTLFVIELVAGNVPIRLT